MKVLDVNDNKPVFTNLPRSINISEETVIGHNILRLQSHDLDLNDFGRVQYSIEDPFRTFAVNSKVT